MFAPAPGVDLHVGRHAGSRHRAGISRGTAEGVTQHEYPGLQQKLVAGQYSWPVPHWRFDKRPDTTSSVLKSPRGTGDMSVKAGLPNSKAAASSGLGSGLGWPLAAVQRTPTSRRSALAKSWNDFIIADDENAVSAGDDAAGGQPRQATEDRASCS